MAKYKIKIDKDKCVGCGACVNVAPEYFEIGEDGKSRAKKEVIDESELEKVKSAKDICPVQAIILEEEK